VIKTTIRVVYCLDLTGDIPSRREASKTVQISSEAADNGNVRITTKLYYNITYFQA